MVILKEKVLTGFTAASAVLILASVALTAFNVSELGTPLILHFDAYSGADFFGSVIDLWLIVGAVFLMMVANVILAEVFFRRERILSYLLIGTNFLLSILLLIVVAVIISVN
jgi:hypothetical protein